MTCNPHCSKCRDSRASVQRPMSRACTKAFSLVEVTLALGIMGFAFVSILGLVPLGLTSFRETKNVSVASQIAQQIFAEVQSTPFAELVNKSLQPGQSWRLPPPGTQVSSDPNAPQPLDNPLRCFDEQGQEISSTDPTVAASIVYRVNVRVLFSPPVVQAQAQNATTTTLSNPALANVTIQIAYNPSNLSMEPVDSTTNPYLWTGKSGNTIVPMFTYETLVARNF